MLWINFVHLYQPANADAFIIKEAVEKSYERLVRALEENPHIKFTANISGCLILRWRELGYSDLIARIGRLVARGQLELTGTAAYHPILPLIPEKEAECQIKENEKILRDSFGENFKPRGFFLPESAYGREAAKIIKKLGYEWIILDEIALNGKLGKTDYDKTYVDAESGLKIIFRQRQLSKSYVPKTLLKQLEHGRNPDYPAVTATDAELYGLRHEDPDGELEKLLRRHDYETETVSGFLDKGGRRTEKIKPVASSWESLPEELADDKPYNLWYNKENPIQKKLWRLALMAYRVAEAYPHDKCRQWARWHLVRGLASCTFWWASAKDFLLFGPISWNPDEIERGLNELIRSIRAIDNEATRDVKLSAEKLYVQIKQLVWERHWAYYWKKRKAT